MTMALFQNKLKPKPLIHPSSANFLREKLKQFLGITFFFVGLTIFAVLWSYDTTDPSFRSATSSSAQNLLGKFGSFIADPLHLAIGISSYSLTILCFAWGIRFLIGRSSRYFIRRITLMPLAIAITSIFLSAHPMNFNWPYPYGLGGVFGDNGLSLLLDIKLLEINSWLRVVTLILAFLTILLSSYVLGFTKHEIKKITTNVIYNLTKVLYSLLTSFSPFKKKHFIDSDAKTLSKDQFKENLTPIHLEESIKNKISQVIVTRKNNDYETPADIDNPPINNEQFIPTLGGVTKDSNFSSAYNDTKSVPRNSSLFKRVQKTDLKRSSKSTAAIKEEQPTFPFEPSEKNYNPPALSLLQSAIGLIRHNLSDDALNENARMLENVLDDYGVKGEVVSVRPGPVVTLYELEPAAGLKASRVIGLSDDIARSMSALSARVSTIPGRSVIGIELPNSDRERVLLREILSSKTYGDSKFQLPLALGKDIGGETIVTNLARMPHLLIAGTTGSGKSVGINTMILSLLYNLTPEQCRLIMIDPKMLELSVYDGIPHLLSPVVTDPKKAVVALKWAVSEMEERYRKMSKMGVRNIDGFNSRVEDALDKGQNFSRTVQTGFDDETGDPTFETEYFTPEKIPYIVIIVDEMADLMMVAGKEIEACIQRLAQMARAAGIHLIMATQRPSVDVITGTIKANFPSRISFQVTSKIDSRTILGEMGAEQLLGMGDMLYMASNGRITRIHGPFVSDEEVEEIVTYLKSQGVPTYVSEVVEGPDHETEIKLDQTLGLSNSENDTESLLYDQAVAIVAKDRKCSTSYIQRRLSIGYNRAAKIVEKMEEQGIVSQANHVGKREILIPEAQM